MKTRLRNSLSYAHIVRENLKNTSFESSNYKARRFLLLSWKLFRRASRKNFNRIATKDAQNVRYVQRFVENTINTILNKPNIKYMEDISEKTIQFRNNEKKKREVETFSTALIMLVSRFVSPARITYNNVSMWKNHLFPENHDRSTYGASQTRNACNLARIRSFVPCLVVSEAGINP